MAVPETYTLDHVILQDLDSTGSATALHTLGTLRKSTDGREFRYVLFTSSGVAAALAAPAILANTTTAWVVTSDTSDGDAEGGAAAGVFASVLTDAYYGWIQVAGEVNLAPVVSTVAAGDALYVGQAQEFASIGAGVSSVSATQFTQCAVAMTAAAGTASTVTLVLKGLR